MATYCSVESLVHSAKRLKISPAIHLTPARQTRCINSTTNHSRHTSDRRTFKQSLASRRAASEVAETQITSAPAPTPNNVRLPKAVQAVFLAPLKRAPTHGIPVCDLQIRSYSVRNLEIWTDFCLRAAYYLNLAAKGPIPLPRITERWTVPRSNFVHKKSQENFERITLRRLIQIQDGHSETVALWLAYIQKHRYYGIGMKANVFEYGGLSVAKDLDAEHERLQKALGEIPQAYMREDESRGMGDAKLEDMLITQPFKAQWGAYGPLGSTKQITRGRRRFRQLNGDGKQSTEDIQLRSDAVLRAIALEKPIAQEVSTPQA